VHEYDYNDDGMWYHEGRVEELWFRVYVGGIEDDAMYGFMFFF